MNNSLKFSRFAHFWKKNDVIAVFHALNRQVLFLNLELLFSIKSFLSFRPDSVSKKPAIVARSIKELKNYELLVPIVEKEERKIERLQKMILSRPCIDTLYLILTDNCNFDCTYCFFEGSYSSSKMQRDTMSGVTAMSAIRKFATYLKRAYNFPDFHPQKPSIIFYGGEPLLNLKVFYSAVKEISRLKKRKQLPLGLSTSVNTNGSLITPEIAAFCTDHKIEVDVSLDGYKLVNDKCRIWKKSRKGTFSKVMKGISILKKAGAKTCISCTISKANADELPMVLEWFLDELGIDQVGFNPLLDSCEYQVQDPEYSIKAAQAMIDCFKVARRRGIHEHRIMRKVEAFVNGELYDRDCSGCGRQIVVRPDGKFGVCHAYSGTGEFFVQPDGSFDPYVHPFWQEWSKRSPLNMSQCHDCEALTVCGGGCPHNAYLRKDSIWEVDEAFCVHAKETVRWLVWDLYAQTQKIEKT